MTTTKDPCAPTCKVLRIGGSLGLTGSHTVASRHALRGLQLLAEKVNASSTCLGPGGYCLKVALVIEDDQSNLGEVRRIYSRMLETNAADVYVGPYGSSASLSVAEIVNAHGEPCEGACVPIMMHAAAAQSIYRRGYSSVFTTNVLAADYIADGLTTLRSLGANSMMAIYNQEDILNQAICQGAIASAQQLGYFVHTWFDTNGYGYIDIVDQLRNAATMQPDVIVCCGDQKDAAHVVLTTRAFNFNPKAMLVTHAGNQDFIDSVGSQNANYIMSPTSFHPQMSYSGCHLFGSAAGFHDEFVRKFQVAPTEGSASAAAAGLALVSAVEEAQSIEDKAAINAAILRLDVATFFGRLSWKSTGVRKNAPGATLQIQPPATGTAVHRYVSSDFILVTKASQVRWPMPTWLQKETEVYPCQVGFEVYVDAGVSLSGWASVDLQCVPCSAGKYRHRLSNVCIGCEDNYYSDVAGLAQCKPCPQGAVCVPCPSGINCAMPEAAPGFYLLPQNKKKPLGEMHFAPCDPPDLCLGGNKCLENYRGIMCAQCMPGFAKGLNGKACGACPDVGPSLGMLGLMFVLYIFYISVMVHMARKASSSARAIHAVILKISVNYLSFTNTALQATEFDLSELDHRFAALYVVRLLTNPWETLVQKECVVTKMGALPHHAEIVIGFVLLPVVLLCNGLAILGWKLIRVQGFNLVRKYFFLRRGGKKHNEDEQNSTSPPVNSPNNGSVDKKDESANVSESKDGSPVKEESAMDHRISVISHQTTEKAGKLKIVLFNFANILDHFVQSGIVWAFLLYPIVIGIMAKAITCIELDTFRLKSNLDVDCASPDELKWYAVSSVGLVLYGIGVPAVISVMLYRVRDKLTHTNTRRIYGFLYNGFMHEYYFYEVICMLRKLFILVGMSVPEIHLRLLALLFLTAVFLSIHFINRPYDDRGYYCLDTLETYSLMALAVTLLAKLVMDIRDDLQGDSLLYGPLSHPLFGGNIWSLVALFHFRFIGYALWSLSRNVLFSYLHFKKDHFPEKVHKLQKLLLFLDMETHHHLVVDQQNGVINISQLSKKEKEYFANALNTTMRYYMDVVEDFRFDMLAIALRETIKICHFTREYRKSRFQKLHGEPSGKGLLHRMQTLRDRIQQATDDGPLQQSGSFCRSLSNLSAKDHQLYVDTQNEFAHIIGIDSAPSSHSHLSHDTFKVTVEEIQNALMLIWPDIIDQKELLFLHHDVSKTAVDHSHAEAATVSEQSHVEIPETAKGSVQQRNNGVLLETPSVPPLPPPQCESWASDDTDKGTIGDTQKQQVVHSPLQSISEPDNGKIHALYLEEKKKAESQSVELTTLQQTMQQKEELNRKLEAENVVIRKDFLSLSALVSEKQLLTSADLEDLPPKMHKKIVAWHLLGKDPREKGTTDPDTLGKTSLARQEVAIRVDPEGVMQGPSTSSTKYINGNRKDFTASPRSNILGVALEPVSVTFSSPTTSKSYVSRLPSSVSRLPVHP